ncbi:unnamed protein product [Caenorhabditis sp. 36 PRJEB53466]|nr:unnamed protein product [Caenorhabditis sp. 36 PRJEB53466]
MILNSGKNAQMFKNLKNRLDSEAGKLKQSAQQYGEQLAAQVGQYRQAMNEPGTGSDSSATIPKRFLNTVTGNNGEKSAADTSIESSSAMMSEIPEADLLGLGLSSSDPAPTQSISGRRPRSPSAESTHSNESTLASLLHSIPNAFSSALDLIPSDSESVASEAFSVRSTIDPAHISRLKQRLTTYKAKYRETVHRHNKLVDDINTTKKLLETTQDESIQKIEKLRGEKRILAEKLREHSEKNPAELEKKCEDYRRMLEQCKQKIRALQEKKETLIAVDEENPRVRELEARIQKTEEEWTNRINESDQQHAINLATTKADMHAALEIKDAEIEQWRRKCGVLEQQDADANQRWHEKVEKVQAMNKALEAEKNEMIEKLSEAKAQGVKAVLEEEEKKRKTVETELNEEIERLREETEKMRLELATAKVQLEAKESSEFDEQREDVEALKLELVAAQSQNADLEAKIADHISNFDLYRLEAEKTLVAAKEQFEKKIGECDTWREKYEKRAAASEHIATVEFETQETETHRAQVFEAEKKALAEKCEELTAKFEKAEKEKDEMAHQISSLKQEMLEKCDRLQSELEAAKALSEETQKKYDDVAERAERIQSELASEKEAFQREKTQEQMDQMSKALEELTLAQTTLEEVSKKLEQSENEAVSTRGALDELATKLKTSEEETALAKTDLEEANQKLHKSETSLAQLSELVESLKTQVAEANQSKEKAVEEAATSFNLTHAQAVEMLKQQLEKAEKELENERNVKNAADESEAIAELKKQLEAAEKAEKGGKEEIERIQNEWAAELTKIRNVSEQEKATIEQLLIDLENARKGELQAKFDGEKAEKEANRTIIELQADVRKEKEHSQLVASQSAADSRMYETGVRILQDDAEEAWKTVEKQKKEREEFEAEFSLQMSTLKQEFARLQLELDEEKALNEELQKKYDEVAERAGEEQKTSEASSEQIQKLQKALEESETRISELQKAREDSEAVQKTQKDSEVERLQNHTRDLQNSLEDAEMKVSELNNSVQNFEAEMEKLNGKLRSSTAESSGKLETLEKEILAREQSERALTEEINVLTASLSEAQLKLSALEQKSAKISELESKLLELETEKEEKVEEVKVQLQQATQSSSSAEQLSETLRAENEQLKAKIREEEEAKMRSAVGGEQKVRELSDLNEKMRVEFIAKEKIISDLRAELSSLGAELVVQKATVEKTKMDLDEVETKEKRAGADRENEKAEEMRLRETFAAELENVSKALEEKETAYAELKSKAERKIAKIKVEFEEKLKADAEKLEISLKNQQESAENGEKSLRSVEERLKTAENANERLRQEHEKSTEHWELEKEMLEGEARELTDKMEQLEVEVKRLQAANETKAAKADTDSRKVVRELQKEVKQLYNELNEKNQQYDALQDEMNRLKTAGESVQNGRLQVQKKEEEEDRRSEFSFQEEIASLKQKLSASLNEADELRLQASRKSDKGAVRKTSSMELHGIADPAEAEYLKNVLYRYMTNRESLGKESVTLARVIGTVARFDDSQMRQVISSEEARQASWAAAVGGTVTQALNR